jgi:ABC-2 type transport system permease protein
MATPSDGPGHGDSGDLPMSAFEQETTLNKSPLHGLWTLTNRELKKWYKAPVILTLSLVQPIIWLGLFGKAMNFGAIFTGSSFNIPGLNIPKSLLDQLSTQIMQQTFGTTDYFSFLAVGMLSFISLFMAMQSGMFVVWDRRLGFLNKELSTPLARGAIPVGKVFASILRALTQATLVLVIAILLGLSVSHFSVIGELGTFAGLFLMVMGFSSLFVMLAVPSSNQDTHNDSESPRPPLALRKQRDVPRQVHAQLAPARRRGQSG